MIPSHPLRLLASTLLLGSVLLPPAMAQSPVQPVPGKTVPLPGHLPVLMATALPVDRVNAAEPITFAISLPLRNPAELRELIGRLTDPNDPQYGQYLTPVEFHARYSPTQADYDATVAFAKAHGLTVVRTHPNRLLLDVAAPAGAVEQAFGVRLQHFRTPQGLVFRAPAAEPVIPAALSGRIEGLIGLDDLAVSRPHNRTAPAMQSLLLNPHSGGSGMGGGFTPGDIRAAYNLNGLNLTGAGQTLALYELDGYTASDITGYEKAFGLPNVTLQTVLVDGFSGKPGADASEVTLDIELALAVAPGLNKILVYEGPNNGAGIVDTFSKIANDNLAKQVSTSWGLPEKAAAASLRTSENSIFQQMAAQGQTVYAAAGDSGAYDNGTTLGVDDPSSQPYMVGVGGTKLATNGAGGAWKSETTWNSGSINGGAGGGGISVVWPIPSYQSGHIGAASKGSTTMRNVPDVALNSDPVTGYSIYFKGQWYVIGGTSCAAPIWAGFTALVNQSRANNGSGPLGFPNPLFYQIGASARYSLDFHDIADGSTNLFYPAVTGYDLATGWGSFNAANLIVDLVAGSVTGGGGTGSGGGTGGGSTTPPSQLLGNPGFENGSAKPAPWVTSTGVIDSSTGQPAHGGAWKAWLDGYGKSHTDTVYQQVALPANITSAALSFYLHIDTAETSKTQSYDTLKVQIRNSSGAVLATLATYSNLNKNTGYTQQTFDMTAYKGQTVQIYLVGTEDSSLRTSFVVDDFALNVK